jgi:hypothetical protein
MKNPFYLVTVLLYGTIYTQALANERRQYTEKGDPIPSSAEIQENKHNQDSILSENLNSNLDHAYTLLLVSKTENPCIAMQKFSDSCLIETETFNEMVRTRWDMIGEFPANSETSSTKKILVLRHRLLQPLLENAYLKIQMKSQGLVYGANLQTLYSTEGDKQIWPERFSDSLLKSYYHHYLRLFSADSCLEIDVLASSDSVLLDSIMSAAQSGTALKKITQADVSGRRPYTVHLDGYQHAFFSPVESESWFPDFRKMELGSWTTSIKTPFGYTYFRIHKKKRIPARSFQQALPILEQLANTPVAIPNRMDLEKEALRRYRSNLEDFLVPDTLILKVWFWPEWSRYVKGDRSFTKNWERDTLNLAAKTMSQFELPSVVITRAYQKINRLRGGEILGPISLPYGKWIFKLLEVKKGGQSIPFSEVRDSILSKIVQDYSPLNRILKTAQEKYEDKQMAKFRNGYIRQIQIPQKDRDTILDSLKQMPGSESISDFARNKLLESMINTGLKQEKYHSELLQWVEEFVNFAPVIEN